MEQVRLPDDGFIIRNLPVMAGRNHFLYTHILTFTIMQTCQFFLERPFGGKPFSNYCLNSKDVDEFFIKILYKEEFWEATMQQDVPFDSKDLQVISTSTFSNGNLVDFKCAEWVLLALKERYEYKNLAIDGERHERVYNENAWRLEKIL